MTEIENITEVHIHDEESGAGIVLEPTASNAERLAVQWDSAGVLRLEPIADSDDDPVTSR